MKKVKTAKLKLYKNIHLFYIFFVPESIPAGTDLGSRILKPSYKSKLKLYSYLSTGIGFTKQRNKNILPFLTMKIKISLLTDNLLLLSNLSFLLVFLLLKLLNKETNNIFISYLCKSVRKMRLVDCSL